MSSGVLADRKDRHLYDACPLCNSLQFEAFLDYDCTHYKHYDKRLSPRMIWNRCHDCEHVFTSGWHTAEAAEILFGKTHKGQQVGDDLEINRHISSDMIDKVLPYKSDGRWLDVGFGNASLLFTAREYGFHPVGIDLRKSNVERLRGFGIEAHDRPLAEVGFSCGFAVISLMDVLEHIPYPRTLLDTVSKLLESKGVLFVSMPNMESPVWDVITQTHQNPYWGEMEHYHNFSRTRLYSLLRDYGIRPVRYGVSKRYRACMEVVAIKD